MSSYRTITAIDSHTLGEPTRVILSGFPDVHKPSMMAAKTYLQQHYDDLRRAIINEPRGHNGMFGAVLLKPANRRADLGVVFMDGGGYLNMCGHGSMGVATVAVERKLVPVTEPYTTLLLDTPAGLVQTKVEVKNGKAGRVTLVNVPAFLYRKDAEITLPGKRKVKVDIAFGGNFFALVNARSIGIPIEAGSMDRLLQMGLAIREAVNRQIAVSHPLLPDIRSVDLVEWFEPMQATSEADQAARNAVVFGRGQIDRSPCGTGTCAKMACLQARGALHIGESFVNESLLGTRFIGRIVRTTTVGNRPAVIPEVTGHAYVTGENRLILSDDDPFEYGIDWHKKGRITI